MNVRKAKEILERRVGFLVRRIEKLSKTPLGEKPEDPRDPTGYDRQEVRAINAVLDALEEAGLLRRAEDAPEKRPEVEL